MNRARVFTAVSVAALLALGGAASASANTTTAQSDEETVVIGGEEYGPEDGLIIEVEQFEIEPGGDPVGQQFNTPSAGVGPLATWGTSYAISTETAQLYYTGKAKAGANIYDGRRIIQVCFWYTRGGSWVSSKYCSNAGTNGLSWWAGPEVTHGVWDSLDPWAPPTIFNISTARVNPYP